MTIFHDVNTWLARIHIGRWHDRSEWQGALREKARMWLWHMPNVPVLGRNGRETVKQWQIAGLLLGLEEADARFFLNRHPDCLDGGECVETAFLAYALKKKGLLSEDVGNQLVSAFEEVFRNEGSVPYRENSPDIRYVDTIGLICPFLYLMGKDLLADRQLVEYDCALYEGVFPFHAYNIKENLPMGVCDWSRGMGWYILGLLESEYNQDRVLRLSRGVRDLPRVDGSFGCFLFNPHSPRESSGTALAGLLFGKAYELSLDDSYLEAAEKCAGALMTMTRRDGTLDFAQGDTVGIALYSMRFDILPFAQDMTLLLLKQLDNFRPL